jgi:GNAT superfamily N-acetyltransferase
MPDVRIRPATVADGELLALINGLAAYEKLTPPDAAGQRRFLAELRRDPPRMWAYVAEAEGQAVGYTVVCETYSTFSMRPKLFLEDIFVVPEARRTGAGLALFRSAVEEAVRRDCSALVWEVLDWNRLAIDFYERLGGRHEKQWLHYKLDEDGMRGLLSEDYSARRAQ